MIAPSITELRTQLLDELQRDLIGPHNENEQLSDRPTVEYLAGILYPGNVEPSPEEDEKLEIDSAEDEEETDADVVILSQTMNPSSLGLSFAVEHSIDHLTIGVTYGLYTKHSTKENETKKTDTWQRQQISREIKISLSTSSDKVPLENGGSLEWIVRTRLRRRSVSIFLVNRNHLPNQEDLTNTQDIDTVCLFQPRLQIRGVEHIRPFIHRIPEGLLPLDADLESYQLLYRDCYEFAIGHGCAADWSDIQGDHAGLLRTSQNPFYELPATIPNAIAGLDLLPLSNRSASPDAVCNLLAPVLDGYEQWILERRAQVSSLSSEKLRSTATIHIELCTQALSRMRAGLELLQKDTQVFEAFRFTNQAMLLQRSYSEWSIRYRRTGKRDTSTPSWVGSWRPFQIAFILLNLPGLAASKNDERDLVDLLWFPTGGGKTEAYLGLTAFTLALRRLRGARDGMNGDGGVTVIMRYTLRLLTTQQFQRATALICACEDIRRRAPSKWGARPFQIGLWVGAGATPNSVKEAGEALAKLRGGEEVREGNPVQLPFCPWCGEKLTAENYFIDKVRDQMVLLCPRKECTFHGTEQQFDKGIPALLVDEDIYHQCPSLLLATVDKFARLPWQPLTMALFGKVESCCPRHGYLVHSDTHSSTHRAMGKVPMVAVQPCAPFLPPELIIQDELHLISGPLGTLSGLYETAIDLLCSYTGSDGTIIRPKIVASTATIRRADDQVRGLFAREVRLFPPSGLNVTDSFFAQAQPLSLRPGRCYVGVYAPGRSVKTALVRVYALLLQVVGEQLTQYGSDNADAYATLLGYFNSLRELGGALRLVEDDIVQRIEYLARRRSNHAPREIKNEDRELTSRIASYKIPELLKRLEIPADETDAIDVLLATNMISVGVDIDRLGLMVVNGQPKTSAEYIQATSRVGRQPKAPGLVVVVYNWSRPRDISHYEHFRPYHEAIYRHVEATSVTPFAPRARDRALHAVLIALARILREQWTANSAADQFNKFHPVISRIKSSILERVGQIDGSVATDVDDQINGLTDWWQGMITKYKDSLRYTQNRYQHNERIHELMHPAEEQRSGGSRPTLNSLREVEGESQLFIDWSN